MQIIPAIYEEKDKEVFEKLDQLKDVANTVQIDVCDGKFCEGKTFKLEKLNDYPFRENFVWEVHLMVENPISFLEECAKAGVLRVFGQIEKMEDPVLFLEKAHDLGFEAGLAFDIDTPLSGDLPLALDSILLMGRKAGKNSNELSEELWGKINQAKDLQEKLGVPFTIAVDGGVEEKHIESLKEAGVDVVYSTHLIFEGNVAENYKRLMEISG